MLIPDARPPDASPPGARPLDQATERSLGLDLLRAIAILLVLACHTHLMETAWSKGRLIWWVALGGFMGVQLFFVLSGFLIGRILIRLAGAGGGLPAWRVFMVRRWMRTLPLYWLVLAVLIAVWPPMFWVPHNGLRLSHLLTYGTLTQNLFWPMPDGWFAVSWSLAVEEWFYLVFSALLLALARRIPLDRALAASLLVFLATPPLLRAIVLGNAAWQASDDHIVPLWFDAIGIGVLAAWLLARLRPQRAACLACLAAGLALVLFVWNGGLGLMPALGQRLRRSFDYDILSIGFALCLPASLRLRTLPAPLERVIRRLSGWSYCLYLTHLSALEIGGFYLPRFGLSPLATAIATLAAVFGIASASWRYVERPILARRPRERLSVPAR